MNHWSAATISILLLTTAPAIAGQGEPEHSHAHSHGDSPAFGEPGDPKKPSRDIAIIMKEADGKMLFSPDKIAVKRGEQIRFKLANHGLLDHEIVVSTLAANLKHAEEIEKNPDMGMTIRTPSVCNQANRAKFFGSSPRPAHSLLLPDPGPSSGRNVRHHHSQIARIDKEPKMSKLLITLAGGLFAAQIGIAAPALADRRSTVR